MPRTRRRAGRRNRRRGPLAAAQAATGQAQPQAAPDPARMKWLLKAWEGQSAKLKTLDVRIYRIDKDFKWKDEVHFEGRAVFKSPDLAYLDFWQTQAGARRQGPTGPGERSQEAERMAQDAHGDDRLRPE